MIRVGGIGLAFLLLSIGSVAPAQDMFDGDTLTGESEDAEELLPRPLPEFDDLFTDETESGSYPLFPVPEPESDAVELPSFPGDSFSSGRTIVTVAPSHPPMIINPKPTQPPITNAPMVPGNQLSERHIGPRLYDFEFRDYGIPVIPYLYPGPMFGPTPLRVPGAGLIATNDLYGALGGGRPVLLIDVLGGDRIIPGALRAPGLSASGDFNDRVQRRAQRWLDRATGGHRDLPIVVYCTDPECWHGYNAALRVAAAGYRNVHWYRGGLRAWEMAGLNTVPAKYRPRQN